MANVQFLRGSQNNLNNLSADKIFDGSFYLTNDTNRLYVANGNQLVELNKSVTIVNTINELPSSNVEDGQFYYVIDKNILCVYRKNHEPKWVQINPDTNTTLVANEKATSIKVDSNKVNITTSVKDTADNEVIGNHSLKAGSNIQITGNESTNEITISSPNVYTKDELDNKLKAVDAMVYRGTLGKNGNLPDLPESGVSAGDTYKVITDGTYANGVITVKSGDLVIATGEEYESGENIGFLETIEWTVVPSGDEIDTQYTISINGNVITLTPTIGEPQSITLPTLEDNDTKYNLDLEDSVTADRQVEIVLKEDGTTLKTIAVKNTDEFINVSKENNNLIIGHKAYDNLTPTSDSAETLAHGDTFSVITEVTRDAGGHLSEAKIKSYTLPSLPNFEDTNTTYDLSGDIGVENNVATVTTSLNPSEGESDTFAFGIKSNSLNISKEENTNNIAVNFIWSEF